jgi:copper(I)-binding protein
MTFSDSPITRAPVVLATFVVLLLVGFAAAGARWQAENNDDKSYVPVGGVDAGNRTIAVDDVWVDAPSGVRAGDTTALRLLLSNHGTHRDALVGVSTSIARRTRLLLNGRPVTRVPVRAGDAVDLEWPRAGYAVDLVDVSRPLSVGQEVRMTFRFARADAISVRVAVGPLGNR